eukprot:4098765-Prymnesium_polylepis.1
MPCQHVTVELTAEGVWIRCGAASVIDELIALDTSTDNTQSVFGYTMTSQQLDDVIDADMNFQGRVKRTADGSFREDDRKLWSRAGVDRGALYATSSVWNVVTRIDKRGSISLEQVMEALAEAGFELMSSHSSANHSWFLEKYIFYRRA